MQGLGTDGLTWEEEDEEEEEERGPRRLQASLPMRVHVQHRRAPEPSFAGLRHCRQIKKREDSVWDPEYSTVFPGGSQGGCRRLSDALECSGALKGLAGDEKSLKPNIVQWTGLRWILQALRRADVGSHRSV